MWSVRLGGSRSGGEDCVNWVVWAPWRKYKDAIDEDGELPEGVPAEEKREGSGPGKIVVETREQVPRDFYIRKEDAEKHGYTKGCEGCSSWFKGLSRRPHNDRCRARFRELMKEEAKVKNTEARREEFLEKMEQKRQKLSLIHI